jgi:hypothetical protein
MPNTVRCIECGAALSSERAELGYRYCTRPDCQALHHRPVEVTAVGTNKGADTYLVADAEEIQRRGEAGELAKKDTALGLNYRGSVRAPAQRPSPPTPRPPIPRPRQAPARQPWTAAQEKAVRVYHDLGLSPRQIAERARQNMPRLGITERLVVQILSAPGRG